MSATIMLATNFDINETTFPVYVSEKMPHDQRRILFEDPEPIIGCIATVKYKPSTYLKLRQPTFQRFHPYKSEPDTI